MRPLIVEVAHFPFGIGEIRLFGVSGDNEASDELERLLSRLKSSGDGLGVLFVQPKSMPAQIRLKPGADIQRVLECFKKEGLYIDP